MALANKRKLSALWASAWELDDKCQKAVTEQARLKELLTTVEKRAETVEDKAIQMDTLS